MPNEVDSEFLGVAKDFPAPRLPVGLFQDDVGGDRFKIGAWKRRRGMRHTDQADLGSAVVSIIGFEMPGLDFALVCVEDTDIHGFTNVTQQA